MLNSISRAALVAALLAAPCAAFAADENPEVKADDTAVSGVSVTARLPKLNQKTETATRLDLTILETPSSVAVMSGDDIRNFGYTSLVEATTRAPGITSVPFPGNGNNSLSARGFYGPNSISQLYDGFQLYNGGGVVTFPFDPWNVERVEVLYGPASIMYGTGFIGGAVNVVTKKPNLDQSYNLAHAAYGSFNSYNVAVDTTGPIVNGLAYRFNASYSRSDGAQDRGLSRSLAASAAITWKPTDKLSFTLSDDFGNIQPTTYEGTPTTPLVVVNNQRVSGGDIIVRLRDRNYNVEDARIQFRENRTYLRTDWAPREGLTFTNDLYYIDHYRKYREVYTYAYNPTTDTVTRTQFRDIDGWQNQTGDHGFVQAKTKRNTFVAGFDVNYARYFRWDNTNASGNFPSMSAAFATVSAGNPVPGVFNDPDANPVTPFTGTIAAPLTLVPGNSTFKYLVEVHQSAAFAQDRFQITDKLSVVGAIRQDKYETTRTDAFGVVTKGDVSGTSGSVGLVYSPDENSSLYVQYAQASDPATSLASIGSAQQPYSLSDGTQVEVGYKDQLMDGKLQFTVAAYSIIKKNLLTPIFGTTLQEQVGQQSSRGVEVSVIYQPVPAWVIEINGANVDAKFDDFNTGSGATLRSLTGYRPQFVPENTANLRTTYSLNDKWQVRGGLHYVSQRYSDNTNTFILPGYSVTEVGASWRFAEKAKLDLRIDNLFDKVYAASTYAGNTTQVILGMPRTITASVNFAF